jgi:hypothetical protein
MYLPSTMYSYSSVTIHPRKAEMPRLQRMRLPRARMRPRKPVEKPPRRLAEMRLPRVRKPPRRLVEKLPRARMLQRTKLQKLTPLKKVVMLQRLTLPRRTKRLRQLLHPKPLNHPRAQNHPKRPILRHPLPLIHQDHPPQWQEVPVEVPARRMER